MKISAAAISLLLFSFCASRTVERPATDDSLMLSTPFGFGRGCYVEGNLYTARHIVNPSPQVTSNASWSDGYGQEGLAVTQALSSFRDLALLQIVTGQPYLNHRMSRDPEMRAKGRVVKWFEYTRRPGPEALRTNYRSARILREFAGLLELDKQPNPGASGTCVFAEDGTVVGLIVWGLPEQVGLVARIHE